MCFILPILDFRESPALYIAARLATKYGERIQIVEPFCDSLPPQFEGTGAGHISLEDAFTGCDIIILLVDHDAFKTVTPNQYANKALLDTRGVYA